EPDGARPAAQGPRARAAHPRVGPGDGAVLRLDLRRLPLRARSRDARGRPGLRRAVGHAPVRLRARHQPAVRRRARAGRLRRLPAGPGRPHGHARREGDPALRLPDRGGARGRTRLQRAPPRPVPVPGPPRARPPARARQRGDRRGGDPGGRAGGPDPRPRPDRPPHGAPAAAADRHRRGGGHRAVVPAKRRRAAARAVAGDPRPLRCDLRSGRLCGVRLPPGGL
ncbi:MAG: hypothetical protein AVDCRST_MAG30-4416, partial [uncultured Solirubrobacteraceae bacterium]